MFRAFKIARENPDGRGLSWVSYWWPLLYMTDSTLTTCISACLTLPLGTSKWLPPSSEAKTPPRATSVDQDKTAIEQKPRFALLSLPLSVKETAVVYCNFRDRRRVALYNSVETIGAFSLDSFEKRNIFWDCQQFETLSTVIMVRNNSSLVLSCKTCVVGYSRLLYVVCCCSWKREEGKKEAT